MSAFNNFQDDFEPDVTDDFEPDESLKKNVEPYKTPYDVKEYSPEELKNMSPSERYQYAQDLKTEREFRQSKGFTKGLLSGASFGVTENIPGLKPEEGDFLSGFSDFIGSTLPITGLYNIIGKPLIKLAAKSPIARNSLSALAKLTGAFGTGASYEGLKEIGKGEMPSPEEMLKHGTEWALLDGILTASGKTGQFAKNLLFKSKATEKPPFSIINDVMNELRSQGSDFSNAERTSAKALSILEKPVETAENISERKIKQELFDKIDQKSPDLAEPSQPFEFNTENAIKDLEKSTLEQRVNKIGPKVENDKALGQNIQKDIEDQFKKDEEVYTPLYSEVENASKNISHSPTQSINLANEIVKELNLLKTRPEGYKKVIDTLNDSLKDMGQQIIEANGEFKLLDELGNILSKEKQGLTKSIPLSNSMELARRLNKIIDYDIIGSKIQNKLKPLVKSLKNEIKQTLNDTNEELFSKFVLAEESYGKTAQKFGKENIHKIRGEEISENIPELIKSPSKVEQLFEVISPKQKKEVERKIADHINSLSHEKAKQYVNEMSSVLSPEMKELSEKLVTEKLPTGKIAQSKKIKQSILDDLSSAFTSGDRPNKTLDLWKTPKGQVLIQDTLKSSPNKKDVLNYLEQQSFYDFASSVISKDGKIDFKKFNEFMKDPAFVSNLRMIGGDESVVFFKNLENLSKSLEKNIKMAEKIENVGLKLKGIEKVGAKTIKTEPTKGLEMLKKAARKEEPFHFMFKDFMDSLDVPAKTIIGLTTYYTLGLPKIIGYYGMKTLYKLARKPQARKAFIRASNSLSKDPKILFQSLEALDEDLKED